MRADRTRGGFSLVELSVALTIVGVLVMMAAPRVGVAVETAKVDKSAATLNSLWLGQRLYRLETGSFAKKSADLSAMRLIKPGLIESGGPFSYQIKKVDASGAELRAKRNGDSDWKGTIVLDKQGRTKGSVSDGAGNVVTP